MSTYFLSECFLATPPYPPACPEGFSGSAYWECECNSPECTLVLLNCNNIWLDSVNCEVVSKYSTIFFYSLYLVLYSVSLRKGW